MTCQRLVTATTTGPIATTSSTAPASASPKNATARQGGASSTKRQFAPDRLAAGLTRLRCLIWPS